MRIKKIIVPSRLIFQQSIIFIEEIHCIDDEYDAVELDFTKLMRIDPFSLLFVSSEIQRFRSSNPKKKFTAKNFQHCSYLSHMGFFKAFGLDYGKYPGVASGSSTYIPIKIFDRIKIIESASENMVNPAEIIEQDARNISKILTRNSCKDFSEVLTYCIREILRNVIEHSNSDQFGFCAQYRCSEHLVSFAIIDRGIGLKESLTKNPNLELKCDKDAIIAALQPAISSKVYKGQKRKPKGDWANSGYGLYMTSRICKRGGSFFIASGDKGYYVSGNTEKYFDTAFMGTILNLAIDTNKIKKLDVLLKEIRDEEGSDIISNIKPSKSSMGLIKKS